MQDQNFKNHARYVPLFHFVMLGIIIAVVVLSIINISSGINLSSVMFLLIAISSLIGFFMIRRFPIAAQDRAIRAEENLRYFSLTGKVFDSRLTLQQIIALRFAPNDELVSMADKAANENMSNKDIKQAIQKWKADHHRA
jgi:L-cystine uptake protein TcyP (sodium:dicarboxylate symporter family)